MANVFANYSFNMNNLNLNHMMNNAYFSEFYDGLNATFHGISYVDIFEVDWSSSGSSFASLFAGDSIYANSTEVFGGTLTGYLELTWNGSVWLEHWGVENASISALQLYQSALTVSTADERTIIESALSGADTFFLSPGNDTAFGYDGNDMLDGAQGDDILDGGNGSDIISGGFGDDTLIGGTSAADLRDVMYGGDGNDTMDGGYGNDELRGDAGDDTMAGGFGADTLIGGAGNDVMTGSAFGDLLFGGDGMDFVNGGWGHDRVNGGADADRFFHVGIFDHGSDWIQDYDAAEGDVLLFGNASAGVDDFQVNFAHTATPEGERSGDDNVEEAFVIYRPTGQIMWALVDGGGQAEINIEIGGVTYDLLA